MPSDPTPLWLDVDTGHDDAFALLLAAQDPNANLLGVTTVHGNATLSHTSYNTRCILEAIGRRDIVVYPGSSKPISRDAVHAADIHGESGLDGVTLLPETVTPAAEGVDFLEKMYSALMATPVHTAWVVSTGTLTNIGLLFMRYPDLAEHIKGLSIMGGAIGGGFSDAPMGTVKGEGERFGNWTPFAEFNIYCDPEAASSLFTNPILFPKTTLIPLDLSHQVLATAPIRHRILYGPLPSTSPTLLPPPTALRTLFTQILTYFAATYASVFALTAGPPLHDPLAVAAALYPALFDAAGGERFQVEIVTEGVHDEEKKYVGQLGRTKAVLVGKGEEGVRIPRALEVGGFWELVEGALGRAGSVTPMRGEEWEWRAREAVVGIVEGDGV